jgi:hypothetical protein
MPRVTSESVIFSMSDLHQNLLRRTSAPRFPISCRTYPHTRAPTLCISLFLTPWRRSAARFHDQRPCRQSVADSKESKLSLFVPIIELALMLQKVEEVEQLKKQNELVMLELSFRQRHVMYVPLIKSGLPRETLAAVSSTHLFTFSKLSAEKITTLLGRV